MYIRKHSRTFKGMYIYTKYRHRLFRNQQKEAIHIHTHSGHMTSFYMEFCLQNENSHIGIWMTNN